MKTRETRERWGSKGPVDTRAEKASADPHAWIGTETVTTRFGDYEFKNGYPTPAAAQALLDQLKFNRAIEVFLTQIPAVSVFAEHRGLREFSLAVYRASSNPEGIALLGLNGSGGTVLAPAVVTSWPPSPTFDPAGTHIVFASSDRIYSIATSGGSSTRLINPAVSGMTHELTPQVARSAGTIFFTAGFGGADLRIWRSDADGSNPVELLADGLHSYRQPAPSPDGTRVAVVEDNLNIRVLDVGPHTLSSWTVQGVSPQWSPVGNQIAYMSNNTIHVVNADGTQDHSIGPTGHSYNPWTVAWSPDAHWIVTHADFPSGLELIDATTGGSISIRNTSSYFYPTWHP